MTVKRTRLVLLDCTTGESSNTVSCVSLSFRTHPCVLAIKDIGDIEHYQPTTKHNYESAYFLGWRVYDISTLRFDSLNCIWGHSTSLSVLNCWCILWETLRSSTKLQKQIFMFFMMYADLWLVAPPIIDGRLPETKINYDSLRGSPYRVSQWTCGVMSQPGFPLEMTSVSTTWLWSIQDFEWVNTNQSGLQLGQMAHCKWSEIWYHMFFICYMCLDIYLSSSVFQIFFYPSCPFVY